MSSLLKKAAVTIALAAAPYAALLLFAWLWGDHYSRDYEDGLVLLVVAVGAGILIFVAVTAYHIASYFSHRYSRAGRLDV